MELPTLHTDYGFLSAGGGDGVAEASNILIISDDSSRSVWAGLVLYKGAIHEWSVARPVRWMRSLGSGRVKLRTDQEPATRAWAE